MHTVVKSLRLYPLAWGAAVAVAAAAAAPIVAPAMTDPYVVENPKNHAIRMIPPSTLMVYREFTIRRDVSLVIRRELQGMGDVDGRPTTVRADVPGSDVRYRQGPYKNTRPIEIPPVPPGQYTLLNDVCWKVLGLYERCVTLPPLAVAIHR